MCGKLHTTLILRIMYTFLSQLCIVSWNNLHYTTLTNAVDAYTMTFKTSLEIIIPVSNSTGVGVLLSVTILGYSLGLTNYIIAR